MYKNKKILALIPARGGSKGVPGKNIKQIAGKPLIVWTIEAALQSQWLDKVIVSTDSEEIASIARKAGAEVPFLRPEYLAHDAAKGIDVVLHAIRWFEAQNEQYDLLLLLQPTSPLRTVQDIENAIRLLFEKKAKAIVSVCENEHPPYWSNTLPPDHSMKNFIDFKAIKNRQELPTFYRLNGAIYLSEIDYLKANNGFWGEQTYAYIMPKERSVDIDSLLDFKLAELLLKERQTHGE